MTRPRACVDWLRYNLIVHAFMSLVSSTLQQRRRFRFDMLSHSIRSSNTLSLGSDKPNCDIGVRFSVLCSGSYISEQIFNYYIITKRECFLNTNDYYMIPAIADWSRAYVKVHLIIDQIKLVRAAGVRCADPDLIFFVFQLYICYRGWA